MPKLVILDVDGTIADSWACMEYCYKATFKEFGREDISNDEFISCFVGDLYSNLERMLHVDGEELDRAVLFYRKTYENEGHTKSRLFDGILDSIRQLHSEGYLLGVATMVYEPYAVHSFETWGIKDLFISINGTDPHNERKKAEMIMNCMEKAGVSKEDTVMIGDGFNDEAAARRTGVGFIAASYGFGITKDNCLEYGYEYAESPSAIPDAVHRHWQ